MCLKYTVYLTKQVKCFMHCFTFSHTLKSSAMWCITALNHNLILNSNIIKVLVRPSVITQVVITKKRVLWLLSYQGEWLFDPRGIHPVPQTTFVFQRWTLHNPVREHPVIARKTTLICFDSFYWVDLYKRAFLLVSQVVSAPAEIKIYQDFGGIWPYFMA